MRIAEQGDRVLVQYVKRLRDGRTVSSRQPLQLIVGINHPRLPGLGSALVGLAAGQTATLTVPPESAYGLSDPKRIRRWPRLGFPQEAPLRAGKLFHFTDERGRRRRVRVLEVDSAAVVVDGNHPWAGQTLELEVKLLGFLEQSLGLEVSTVVATARKPRRSRVIAFECRRGQPGEPSRCSAGVGDRIGQRSHSRFPLRTLESQCRRPPDRRHTRQRLGDPGPVPAAFVLHFLLRGSPARGTAKPGPRAKPPENSGLECTRSSPRACWAEDARGRGAGGGCSWLPHAADPRQGIDEPCGACARKQPTRTAHTAFG
jgi:peptidylprolyl isomerase